MDIVKTRVVSWCVWHQHVCSGCDFLLVIPFTTVKCVEDATDCVSGDFIVGSYLRAARLAAVSRRDPDAPL